MACACTRFYCLLSSGDLLQLLDALAGCCIWMFGRRGMRHTLVTFAVLVQGSRRSLLDVWASCSLHKCRVLACNAVILWVVSVSTVAAQSVWTVQGSTVETTYMAEHRLTIRPTTTASSHRGPMGEPPAQNPLTISTWPDHDHDTDWSGMCMGRCVGADPYPRPYSWPDRPPFAVASSSGVHDAKFVDVLIFVTVEEAGASLPLSHQL